MFRFLTIASCSVLALVSIQNFGKFMDGTPSFDPDTRKDGVFGDWRVAFAPALYNRSDYLFQLGHGFANSDALASAAIEASDELADPETAAERAQRAIENLEESVSLAPGNAHAWNTLAWSYGLNGDFEAARDAIGKSWLLAPYNYQLALSRLGLAELLLEPVIDEDVFAQLELEDDTLSDEELDLNDEALFAAMIGDAPELSDFEKQAVLFDLEAVRRFSPGFYLGLVEDIPAFADIAADLPPEDEDS